MMDRSLKTSLAGKMAIDGEGTQLMLYIIIRGGPRIDRSEKPWEGEEGYFVCTVVQV